MLPILLSVDFYDAPIITTTSGCIGDAPFVWQIDSSAGSFNITSPEIQQEKVTRAMERLEGIVAPSNRRLLVGLSYFNRAMRLEESGATAFEFTGEVMLNLAKCLEALFPATEGGTRDAVRAGLTFLGYSTEDIETWFIPAMALRSAVDSAHVRLTLFSYEQLVTIQHYCEQVVGKFRTMIQHLLSAVEAGSFSVTPYEDAGADSTVTALLERMTHSLSASRTASE